MATRVTAGHRLQELRRSLVRYVCGIDIFISLYLRRQRNLLFEECGVYRLDGSAASIKVVFKVGARKTEAEVVEVIEVGITTKR